MDSDIVIEVRGGALVGVYCNNRDQRFIFLDWDDLNELPEAEHVGGVIHRNSFSDMHQETRSVYDRTVLEYQGHIQ
ncbi:MAG: hypothetical protein JXM79_24105 [Sedimentisphaerales bacterium]|nr:hypothetical protein [Sedimentisphaerales bacterium]